MKKIKYILFLFLTSVLLVAQPYGHTQYPNSSHICSGSRVGLNGSTGFLMAGMKGTDFHIDKTNGGPLFNYSTPLPNIPIESDYSIFENGGCLSSNASVTSCIGVSAIEISRNGIDYAVAGAYNNACFVSFLAIDGSPAMTYAYPFPYSSTNIMKPSIVASQSGDFYVCGKFDTSLYVMKIDIYGAVAWSNFYSCGQLNSNGILLAGGIFEPAAIIESPFNGDVIVTGKVDGSQSYNRGPDGFFLSLDENNGNVNIFKWIGDAGIVANCNVLAAIIPAYSTNPGGYVLAGTSDPYVTTPANVGTSWLMKVDLNGHIIWSRIYTSTNDPIGGGLYGVVERLNSFNQYEYYATGTGGSVYGAFVYKLDANGIPFSYGSGGDDEFYYNTLSTSPILPIAISYAQGTGLDDGIQIYADNNTNHYLIEAYFNGVSGGCNGNEILTQIATYESGHNSINPWINLYGSLSLCTDLSITAVTASNTPNQLCTSSSIIGGNNARSVATGIAAQNIDGIQISPNPSTGEFVISADQAIDLQITNELGQLVKIMSLSDGHNDVKVNNLSNGVYFITGKNDNGSVKQKIVITK